MDRKQLDDDNLVTLILSFKNSGDIECTLANLQTIDKNKNISKNTFSGLLKLIDALFNGELNEGILNVIAAKIINEYPKQITLDLLEELKKMEKSPAVNPIATDVLFRF